MYLIYVACNAFVASVTLLLKWSCLECTKLGRCFDPQSFPRVHQSLYMQPSPYVPNSPSISVEKQDPNAFIQASSSSPAQANEDQSKSKPNSPIRPGDIASVAHQTSISCRHSQVLSPHNQEPDITLVLHAIHANTTPGRSKTHSSCHIMPI